MWERALTIGTWGRRLVDRTRYLLTTRPGLGRLGRVAVPALAIAVALAQAAAWMLRTEDRQDAVFIGALGLCGVAAVFVALPPDRVSARFRGTPGTTVELRVADLLQSAQSVVVGVSDRIDNEFPERLHESTLVAQLWADKALPALQDEIWPDDIGHDDPLPIGHIAEIARSPGRQAYVLVFARLAESGTASTPTTLLEALDALWHRLRRDKVAEIHLPVLGSGYGGARLRRPALIALIAMSFTLANDRSRVCDRLVVNVSPTDYQPGEFAMAREMLRGLGYVV